MLRELHIELLSSQKTPNIPKLKNVGSKTHDSLYELYSLTIYLNISCQIKHQEITFISDLTTVTYFYKMCHLAEEHALVLPMLPFGKEILAGNKIVILPNLIRFP